MVNPPTACAAFPIGDLFSIPTLLGITYNKRKVLPKIFSKSLIEGMEQCQHMGKKLQKIAEDRNLKPKDVAAFFVVKPPSVYDWYEHGRIAKRHYKKLEEFSGKPITWWLSMTNEPTISAAPTVQENRPALQALQKNDPWPFSLFGYSEWLLLSKKEREDFEKSIAGAILWAQKTAEQH